MNRISFEQHACSCEWILHAQQGDKQALEWVMRTHEKLIGSLARRFQCEWANIGELVQAGNVGLLMALRSYVPAKQTKLSTYAVPWILGEMRCSLRRIGTACYSLDEPGPEDGRPLRDLLVAEDGVNLDHLDLHLALSRLTQEEQILLSLRYFRGKTQKESAVILKKSQAQISKMESRILCELRMMLS